MNVPLRADAERNRQRLLVAARELFAQRGLDVTLDDIARHAGVGVGTAYRRFADKDVLFSPGRGRERVAHARRALAPAVAKLVARAVEAGAVRGDMSTTDVPVINFMLNTVVDFSRDVEPELYKRYVAIVLDGLRRRDDNTPLAVDALSVP